MAAFLNSGTYNQQSTTQRSSGNCGEKGGWAGFFGGVAKCIHILVVKHTRTHTQTYTLFCEAAALDMTRHLNAI